MTAPMADIPEKVAPLLDNTAIVNPNGTPSVYFLRQWLAQRVNNLSIADLIAEINALNSRTLTAGVGLTGGGDLSADRTFDLANTAVAPGTYGDATHVPQFTVDQQGRITSVADVLIAGGGGGSDPAKFYSDRTRMQTTAKSGSSYASKGMEISPLVNMDVHRVSGYFTPVSGASYTACLAPIAASGGTTITSAPVFSSTLVMSSDVTVRWSQFLFPVPASLVAGNFYMVLISRADASDTYVLPITFATNNAYPDAALDIPVIPDNRYALLAKAVPASGHVAVRSTGSMPAIGMMIETT